MHSESSDEEEQVPYELSQLPSSETEADSSQAAAPAETEVPLAVTSLLCCDADLYADMCLLASCCSGRLDCLIALAILLYKNQATIVMVRVENLW